MRRLILALFVVLFSTTAFSAPLILNEYNGVREDKVLKDGGTDPFLGTPAGTAVLGNGSLGTPTGEQNDWFEMVVIADGLDARGWEFRLIDDGNVQIPLILSQDALWSNLAAGTLIVVFESDDIPEDLDASDGRLAVRVNGNGTTPATYIGPQQDIDVSNSDFEITVADHKGRVVFGPTGEAIVGEGVNSEEVFKLEADPTAIVTGSDLGYNDGSSSTFGAANVFSAGTMTQDLSNLLNGTPVLDADFDGIADCRDNCRLVYNPDQTNTDRDGAGNACDPDVNNDGVVGTPDFNAVRSALGTAAGDAGFDEAYDLNDDDLIDAADLNIVNTFFGSPPGPGAQANALCDVNDPTAAVFDPTVVQQVDIVMAPADWDFVRGQTRDLLESLPCAEVEPTSPFEYRPATVTVNGTVLTNVGVRKKGFQGSLSSSRPSLKVDFGEFTSGQQYSGMDRLTLNNMRQDPSDINTCMSYYLMAQAGVPAPRCNYAHVTINGVDRGIFANVESIKNPYLIRNFGSAAGKLYEGTIADLRAGYFGRLEIKNSGDRTDLLPLAHLLEGTDAEIIADLANQLNVDEFMTFWAMEGLIGHWDGYNQGNNNFYIYNDPATGIRFFPWGADDTLDALSGLGGAQAAISPAVFLNSQLAKRLWDIPSFRAQFLTRLNELRALLFPSGGNAAVIAEVDRQGALVNDPADPWFTQERATEIAKRRQWVIDRWDHVETELAAGPTSPTNLSPRACLQQTPGDTVVIDVDVAVTNDNADPGICGSCGTPTIIVNGSPRTGFGPLQKFDRNANPVGRDDFGLLNVLFAQQGTVVLASVDATLVPSTLPAVVDIPEGLASGIVANLNGATNAFSIAGFLRGAQLSLTSFGTNVGDQVTGQLTAGIVTFTLAPPTTLPPLPGTTTTSGTLCGLGFELTLILPAVLWIRRRRIAPAALAVLLSLGVLGAAEQSHAVPIVELVFVEQNGGGIAPTSSVNASAGDSLKAVLQITADAAGVSSYGISLDFDTDGLDELDLVSVTEVVNGAFDINLGGNGAISQTDSGLGTPGSIVTIAAGASGPGLASATFQIAMLSFTVNGSVATDGVDLLPGFGNTGVDSIFSTTGTDLTSTATVQGASVNVPEPMLSAMVLIGAAAVFRRRAQRA